MKNKKTLLAAIATFGASAALLGTGTFAWYQFSNTANVGMNGAALEVENSMKFGLFTTTEYADAVTTYKCVKEDVTGGYIYWTSSTPSQELINGMAGHNGYSTNVLTPVTTSEFDPETESIASTNYSMVGNFKLADKTVQAASKTSYFSLNLVFKVVGSDGTTPVSGKNIYLNGIDYTGENKVLLLESGSTRTVNIDETARVGFKSFTSADFNVIPSNVGIIAPKKTVAGSNRVTGTLDLNGDGINDYTKDILSGEKKEVYYGVQGRKTADNALVDATYKATAETAENHALPFDPVNNPWDAGKTEKGVYGINTEGFKDKVAHYSLESTYDFATKTNMIATTGGDGLAYVNIDLWLEGFDHDCVNGIGGLKYGANIKFAADI